MRWFPLARKTTSRIYSRLFQVSIFDHYGGLDGLSTHQCEQLWELKQTVWIKQYIGCLGCFFQRASSQKAEASGIHMSPSSLPEVKNVWVPDIYIRPPGMTEYVTLYTYYCRWIDTVEFKNWIYLRRGCSLSSGTVIFIGIYLRTRWRFTSSYVTL